MLRDYLTGKRQQDRRLRELAALALRAVYSDDVLVSLRLCRPVTCALCAYPKTLRPVAIKAPGHTEVILICAQCSTDHIDKQIMALSGKLETCFLWEVAGTIMVLDDSLQTEILSA